MKKKTLTQRLHEEYFPKYSKKKVYRMVNFLIEKMKQAMVSEDGLKVSGFGSFKRGSRRIVFRPSKKVLLRLKSGINRSKM